MPHIKAFFKKKNGNVNNCFLLHLNMKRKIKKKRNEMKNKKKSINTRNKSLAKVTGF